jgi:hypothetical protein
MTQLRQSRNRLDAFRRYLLVIAIGNLVWEAVQLPLYTIWVEGSWSQIGFAWVHCTLGDVLIGAAALLGALMLCRMPKWPMGARGRVAAVAMILAVIYTIFSEWLNVEVRHSWAYRDIMPTLPWFGTGLSPVLQWIVVPLLALQYAQNTDGNR